MARLDPTGVSRILSYIKNWVTTALGGKANSSHTHTKSQITDFPTIPTVNNATLTIQKNGTTVNSFTANASSNVTANITVPTKVSELTNDSGYITSSGSCNYANSAGSVAWGNVSGKPSSYTPSSHNHDSVYLKLSGGTITGNISKNNAATSWVQGRNAAPFRTIAASSPGDSQYVPCWSAKSYQGSWDCGPYTSNVLHLSYITDANYNSGSNAQTADFTFATDGTFNAKVLKQNGTVVSLSGHTHTKSQITDFPSIPSKTSQLTNDSGYITSSGSCNYANSAGYVQGNNNSANAANALLRSGSGRTDSSPEGDTWIFFDECGAPDAPWGFKHNQGANTIGFYGRGTETSSINLSNGYFSGSCNYANSSGNADTLDGYHHDSFPKTSAALFTVNGLGTPGWSKIGTGEGGSCIQVKTTDNTYPSICFHRSGHSHCVLAESGGQLGTMQQGGSFNHLITSANIGSQSVNYATSAGSAGSVAWGNVSGRPTALSQFTNDSEFWSPGGGKWNPNANISLTASGSNQEWSFDIRQNGNSGCYWHVWSDVHGSMLRVDADNGAVRVPKNIFYLGSYKIYVG